MPRHEPTTDRERFERHVDRTDSPDGCWLWTGSTRKGYGELKIGSQQAGTRRKTGSHRFALGLALGRPILPGMQALHTCDVRSCVRHDPPGVYLLNGVERPCYGHLFEGTPQDNMDDMCAKGRSFNGDRYAIDRSRLPKGPDVWNAKLTESKVLEIRRRGALGESFRDLAVEYGVSASNVSLVLSRRRWTHI